MLLFKSDQWGFAQQFNLQNASYKSYLALFNIEKNEKYWVMYIVPKTAKGPPKATEGHY